MPAGVTVLLPESALAQLGATAERVPAIGRTYWSLEERLTGSGAGKTSRDGAEGEDQASAEAGLNGAAGLDQASGVAGLDEVVGADDPAGEAIATAASQKSAGEGAQPGSPSAGSSGTDAPGATAGQTTPTVTTVGEYTVGRVTASIAEYTSVPAVAPNHTSAAGPPVESPGAAAIPGNDTAASIANLGSALRLRLPVQQRLGQGYVDAAFAQRLAGVELQMVGDVLYVARRIGGQIDVDGHWAEDAVAQLLGSGVVGGYGDGTFRPNTTLSRAAFVKMLVGSMGLQDQPGATGGFADTGGHWSAREGQIGAAVAAGIVKVEEYPRGRFEPDRAIGREEMAVMLVRALGLEAAALAEPLELVGGQVSIGGRVFRDAGAWSRPAYVAAAIRAGLITGYEESDGRYTFRPGQTATRAEAATMVVRAMGYRE